MVTSSRKTQSPKPAVDSGRTRRQVQRVKPLQGALARRGAIEISGVCQHNLKGFDVDLPLGQLIVVTGPSGSGKTSFAFDTVYAEGQRRYVETFSPYTRQFFDRMDKPQVREVKGIPPAIALEQRNTVRTSRSTVGTLTEVNDYLKLLYGRLSDAFCSSCGKQIQPDTPTTIVPAVFKANAKQQVLIAFPVALPESVSGTEVFSFLQKQGYLRVYHQSKVWRTDEAPPDGLWPRELLVVQDRVKVEEENRVRLTEAVEAALDLGRGRLVVIADAGEQQAFSANWTCPDCAVTVRPPTPALFSFNHPLGACPECRGFGRVLAFDPRKAIPDPSVSLKAGAVRAFSGEMYQECQRDLLKAARREGINVDTPFYQLPEAEQEWVLEGEYPELTPEERRDEGHWYGVKGFFEWLESRTYKMHVRVFLSRFRSGKLCPACGGGRYQTETLNYKLLVDGKHYQLPELNAMPVKRLLPLFEAWVSSLPERALLLLADQVLSRLRFLEQVGLGYLTLDRPARTLSGGESQRVNLTTCLGAALVNTLFVLDEPTIGLHPRDTFQLIEVLHALRDRGNTLLVVEHEESVIRAADYLVDIGPGRGRQGGELVYAGVPEGLAKIKRSLTGAYLHGHQQIPMPSKRRQPRAWLELTGVEAHNLNGVDVKIPLGVITGVSGVSGSGKSTLVNHVLYGQLAEKRGIALEEAPGLCRGLKGDEEIDRLVLVDQSPLTKTPRSTPALYLGVFDSIRTLFAAEPEAVAAGFKLGDFSFNGGSGRCGRCGGAGFEKVEMQFLSDIYIRCEECEGRRYIPSLLQVKHQGKSVHEVLDLTVDEALLFFAESRLAKKIVPALENLSDVGLGYLQLGQPLNTLSGGESQRLKLVSHLLEKREGHDLLIFDEPTTGLHFDDVAKLLVVFHRLADAGHSLLIIEHNLDVLKSADYVIDLGPEGGENGGQIMAVGTPEELVSQGKGHTAEALETMFQPHSSRVKETPHRPDGPILPGRDGIEIVGAREHNLKNLNLTIEREKFTVVTGLSGSGKSTLAFDLLFAEGQRRFLDSMSPYARQFVAQMEKPDVDLIAGLPPTVAIEQRVTRGGGKSTVATVTEAYHFLRLLYSKLGQQHCPDCGCPVSKQTVTAMVRFVEEQAKRGKCLVLAPVVKARKGFHTEVAEWAGKQGYERLLVDKQLVSVKSFPRLERYVEHSIDVVVGEVDQRRIAKVRNLTARALEIGKGSAKVLDANKKLHVLSTEQCCPECGQSFEPLDPRLFSFNSPHGWCEHCRGLGQKWQTPAATDEREGHASILEQELREERSIDWLETEGLQACDRCDGTRLNPQARAVRFQGVSLGELAKLPVGQARQLVAGWKLKGDSAIIAQDIVPEVDRRLAFLEEVGLSYLNLNRSARSLSGGESQRIRLAAQLGSNLSGVLYVLDEPTIGLHPRDKGRLLQSLGQLQNQGNTLVVVEHDEETMQKADHIIDLGPGAGRFGGEVVGQGTIKDIMADEKSVTGRFLRQGMQHPMRGERRELPVEKEWIGIEGATLNNLKDVDVRIPKGCLTVFCGISGSGKSSLMRGVLGKALSGAMERSRSQRKQGKVVRGSENEPWKNLILPAGISSVYEVDQSPIGRSPRSTPATYIKLFDDIRSLYSSMPSARVRGFGPGRFSFNTAGGRCETCEGQGVVKLEMNFLPTSHLPCEACGGKRFNAQTLEVTFQGKTIADVMTMTVDEASEFFEHQPRIARPLQLLVDTGLGYLQLGQASPTLSGGEAQRIKLVAELARRRSPKGDHESCVYLLEEPTIGLHASDVERLLQVLHRLVDHGHTVVVIEHHLDIIAEADYLVELGPEAGDAGGRVVASGRPEELTRTKGSATAPFLAELLGPPPKISAGRRKKAAA